MMSTRLPLLLAVMLVASLLAGCLGSGSWEDRESWPAAAWAEDGSGIVVVHHTWEEQPGLFFAQEPRNHRWTLTIHDGYGKATPLLERQDWNPPMTVAYHRQQGFVIGGGYDLNLFRIDLADASYREIVHDPLPADRFAQFLLAPDGLGIVLWHEAGEFGDEPLAGLIGEPERVHYEIEFLDTNGTLLAMHIFERSWNEDNQGGLRLVWSSDSAGVYACVPSPDAGPDEVLFLNSTGGVAFQPGRFPVQWTVPTLGGEIAPDGRPLPWTAQGQIEIAWRTQPVAAEDQERQLSFTGIMFTSDPAIVNCAA